MCGGALGKQWDGGDVAGLSPRVRGSRTCLGRRWRPSGIIPACAGEPSATSVCPAITWDYPRVCGGARHFARKNHLAEGLSPRVRGSHVAVGGRCAREGIIPACAGEPTARRRQVTRRRDYPRVCGGASIHSGPVGSARGLSPRVRGSPDLVEVGHHRGGIIPACAGEPRSRTASTDAPTDYPRVCGGALERRDACGDVDGLSPRVRGSRREAQHDQGSQGIIPACAGEPTFGHACPRDPWDYPRVCGGARRTSSSRSWR